MRYKILIDPHPFLESVLNSLQIRYDVELLSLSSAIQHYGPQCTTVSYSAADKFSLKNDTLSGFPSWFTEKNSTVERIVIKSLKEQLIKYGPWIEAMDLCLQNEDISLILLWNDVTALTKSLTFLGKRYGIPSLHVSHGIPLTAEAHGKIWADKIAVFGDSSREFYLANGNQPEKTVITGNPYWDNWGPCSSHDVKKIKGALGLKNDKKVVMFAPTWYHNFRTAIDPELKVKKDLEILLDTMSQLKLTDKVDLLVKLHGGHKDKTAFYDRNIKARGFSYKIITEASPLPLIQVSDVILCAGSMVVEALLAGKPIIYNVCDRFESEQHFDSFMSHSFTLDAAPFYVALNRDDLSRDLSRALNNHGDFSTEEIKKFLHRQNGPCDGKATERVAELAMEMAGNNKNRENRVKFISPVSYRKRKTYYSNIRQDIPSMIAGNPQRILEVGCAEGAMGAVLRKKYDCEYVGVEINSEAAHKAEERLDRVIIADVEKTNLKEYRIAETGFDYIIYGDVLEHLYDPWTVIYEHKKLLKDDGYVVVSIPNVRNLKIIDSLVNGNWTYRDEGILDSTHLRFFTLQEVKKMFINCGYNIVDVKCITNPVFDLSKIQGQVNVDLPKMTIKNVSKEEMLELSTVQFMIKAQKATVSESVSHPKCSIIIPVFNQVEYTRQCIEALYKNTPSSLFEIIVVDNNSTDGTKDYLSGIPEKVKVITNQENLGFAKACNQGAEHSRGYYLVFLNNDTLPQPDWLREMVDSANSDADAGIVGTKLLYPDGTIQHAGIGFINGIPDHPFRDFPGDHPEANIPKELDMVTGACLLIKRDVFIECGGFDEQYKNGVEDIDLCLKARMKGYKVIYNPKSTLYHYEGRTLGRFDHVKENLEIFFSRWGDYFDDHGNFFNKAEDKKILIQWEGSQFVNHSLALVNRELCLELAKRQNIELSLIPYEPHEFGLEEDPDRFGQIEERLRKTLCGKADFHIRHQWPPNFSPPTEGHWIIMQPWEFGALPKDWVEPMETLVDELWVPSNYVRDVYVNSGISASKVFVVPNGVNYHQFNPAVTKYKLDTQKRFKFLFVGGTIMRKGIDILLDAFTTAFSNNDDVCLVIKDMGGESFYRGQNAAQNIKEIKKNATTPEILYITETLSNEEVAGLYTACDCLVHPYRGEGFGLPVAEAMACGLPVIVTKGGACDDFCSDENAYLIDSTVKPVHLNNYVLSAPGWLLEPDKTQLIERLRFVCEQPEKAKQKGAVAARQIRKRVDWKMSTNQIMDRLRALKGKPVQRFAGSPDTQVFQTVKLPQDIYQTIQQSMKNKRLEEVINELEMLAESYPQFALAQNDLGVLHYQAGNREMALKFYENAVQLDPGNMVFQKNLADFYYVEMGRVEDALRIYVKILEANPEDVETLMATGQICKALERPDDARDFFNQVLQIEPWNTAACLLLEELERPLTTVDLMNAESPEGIYQNLQSMLNNLSSDEVIGHLQKLMESFPDFALVYNDLGVLYYNGGDKEKALNYYQKAVQLEPANATFQKNLADYYLVELDSKEEALQIYLNLLNHHPNDLEANLTAAHICVVVNKFNKAKELYKQVLVIDPENEDARNNLRTLDKIKGDFRDDQQPKTESPQKSTSEDESLANETIGANEAPTKDTPQFSLIMPTSAPQKQIRRCVESIKMHTSESHEILFVNNGTTKGVIKWLRQCIDENHNCHLVKCGKGANPAVCYNTGLKAARGEYIVLLSNDVVVTGGWLSSMLQCFSSIPNAGIVGTMANRARGRQKVAAAVNTSFTEINAFAESYRATNRYRRIVCDILDSFCLLFRRDLTDKIGLFDEQMGALGFEDEDYCLRATLEGYVNQIAGDVYLHRLERKAPSRSKKNFYLKWSGADVQSQTGKCHLVLKAVEKANRAAEEGKIDLAVELFLQAIGLVPERKESYYKLAEMLVNTKRFQDALDVLNELPERDPDARQLALAACCKEGLDLLEEAEGYADRALELNRFGTSALNTKGIIAFRRDDKNAAESYFVRAMEMDPGFGEAYTNLGALKWTAGLKDEALSLYECGFILSPRVPDIALNYHCALADLGEYQRAENIVRDAAVVHPRNKKIRYMLIDILLHQQNHEMAMQEIETAIADFGIDDGILSSALKIREKMGPLTISRKTGSRSTVSLCMIVKDEEEHLAKCLQSVKPLVDEIIVVDTGSRDRSRDIARVFGAKVFDFEWAGDFAEARNYSLSKATGKMVFVMDADEVISPLDYELFRQTAKQSSRQRSAFIINTRNYTMDNNLVGWVANEGYYDIEEAGTGWTPSAKIRLFPNESHIRFNFPVHEMVEPSLQKMGIAMKLCKFQVHHYGKLNRDKSEKKGETYYEIGCKKLEEMGDAPVALRELAIQAEGLKKHEEAIELWERFIAIVPNEPKAYINMGISYCSLGQFDKVLATAEKVLKLAPDSKEGHYNCALAKLHLGHPDQAIEILEKLCEKIPEYLPARFILAAAWCCREDKKRGMALLKELSGTTIGPGLAIRCHELASRFVLLQRPAYALALLNAAIDSQNANKDVLDLYADCLELTESHKKTGTYE